MQQQDVNGLFLKLLLRFYLVSFLNVNVATNGSVDGNEVKEINHSVSPLPKNTYNNQSTIRVTRF